MACYDKNIFRRTVTALLSQSLLCSLKHKTSLTSTSVQKRLRHIFLQKHKTNLLLWDWGHLLRSLSQRQSMSALVLPFAEGINRDMDWLK